MNKFAIDYSALQDKLEAKKAFKLSEVQHKIKKVAFDVVKFTDSNDSIDGLWQIHHSDDGDYIVAMYDDGTVSKSSSDWRALADNAGNVNIFYKNTPITRVSLASLGVPAEDTVFVCNYLPVKLASNQNLTSSLLNQVPNDRKVEIFNKHPELKGTK